MSWADLAPPKGRGGANGAAEILLSMTDGSGRYTAGCVLLIRTHMMEDAPAWLRVGALISVAMGSGDHAGHLRITPGGPFLLARGTGRAREGTLKLRLAPLPGVQIVPHPPSRCGCDWSDGWLELELPAWARPAPAPPKHVPLSERVPDPAAQLREQAAGRRK